MQEEIQTHLQEEAGARKQEIDLLTERLGLQANRVSMQMCWLHSPHPLHDPLCSPVCCISESCSASHERHGSMQIEELDAEIKHAFADLEHNERARQELQAKSEELASQLTDAKQHMKDLAARLHSKSSELEEVHASHNRVKVLQRTSVLLLPWHA